MFGAKLQCNWNKVSLSETFSGYCGWEHMVADEGLMAHDFPMSFKTKLNYSINEKWTIFGLYEHGLTDYPYRHIGLGMVYKIDILKKK